MKSPAEYLDSPVLYLTYPTGAAAEFVPVVTYDGALHAIEKALADAEEYKYLLLRALRRKDTLEEAVSLSDEGALRPLFPTTDEQELAA